jgi:hypothetical protein
MAEPSIMTAARIGDEFNIDPLVILDETDPFRWSARVAAYAVVQADRKAARDAANRKRGVG